MRIFVTGATGFVGSAIVQELLRGGHEVLGLARSEAGAKSLIAAGAQVHRGDLEDLESLRSGAAASEGVIHAGFIHDFSRFEEVCKIDQRAIEALGSALAGTERPLIVTGGTALLAPGRMLTEDEAAPSGSASIPRVSEQTALAMVSQGVRASVVRLPPSVHGEGDHAFVPMLIHIARAKGASAFIGTGQNRWPAVHRFDAARLYRLVLEKGVSGTIYHGVAEEGVPFQEIAEVIGRRLKVPVMSKSPEEAAEHFGSFVHFAAIDNVASSARTQQWLGWHPTEISLLNDIDDERYFRA